MVSFGRSVTFCASARTGLGHLRRITNIAAALRRLKPECQFSLVSNAPAAGLSPSERALFDFTYNCGREQMAGVIAKTGADLVVVDTAVIPNLELLPQALLLILRETVDSQLPRFCLPGGRRWDEALVAAPEDAWTVASGIIGAKTVTNVGWIYRSSGIHGEVLPRDEQRRTVLIATGGGGNDMTATAIARELTPVIAAVRRSIPADSLRVLQIAGPRAPATSLLPNVEAVIDVGSRLDEAFAASDLVISTTGYNSVLELATTDTPVLLVAIERTFDDQSARARTWGQQLGLDHHAGEPQRSAEWIVNVLTEGTRRAPVDLGTSGCQMAARRIVELLEKTKTPDPRRHFTKYVKLGAPSSATTVQRSQAIFDQHVPTCPGLQLLNTDAVAFARLEGPTALELWHDLRRDASDRSGTRRLSEFCCSVLRPLAHLHTALPEGLDLPALDVSRRIIPRLAKPGLSLPKDTAALIDALCGSARFLSAAPIVTAHGDFHLRQLIRPKGREDFILVDLDDLTLGPAEADIGNCLAHLSTTEPLDGAGITDMINDLIPQFIAGYAASAQRVLDSDRVRLYASIALIRRGLKLNERGTSAAAIAAIFNSASKLAVPNVMGKHGTITAGNAHRQGAAQS